MYTERAKGQRIRKFKKKLEVKKFEIGDLVYLRDKGRNLKKSRILDGSVRVTKIVGLIPYEIRGKGN